MLPSIERTEPARTVIVPRVPPPPSRGRLRFLLPWLAFGAVAVVIVVGSSLWSVTLRSASRTAPEPVGIDTAAAPATPPPVTALPTTPAAATATTEAVVVRSPRLRVVAPRPAPAPPSVEAPPSAPPPTDPAPVILPPADCADSSSCAAPSHTEKKSVDESTTLTATEG